MSAVSRVLLGRGGRGARRRASRASPAAAAFFDEHAAARDLGDVGGLEVDLEREAVHQAGELDLLVVEAADELAELLLRGDDDPVLAAARRAEALHDGLQVEHLLDVAGDELADLVDDEHQRLCPGWRRFISSLARSASLPGVMSALSLTAFTQESAVG